jgi:hypothetical protein
MPNENEKNDFKIVLGKNSQKNSHIMFQICVPKKKNQRYNLKSVSKCNDFDIKIRYIINIIEISKSMEPNKCIH